MEVVVQTSTAIVEVRRVIAGLGLREKIATWIFVLLRDAPTMVCALPLI